MREIISKERHIYRYTVARVRKSLRDRDRDTDKQTQTDRDWLGKERENRMERRKKKRKKEKEKKKKKKKIRKNKQTKKPSADGDFSNDSQLLKSGRWQVQFQPPVLPAFMGAGVVGHKLIYLAPKNSRKRGERGRGDEGCKPYHKNHLCPIPCKRETTVQSLKLIG